MCVKCRGRFCAVSIIYSWNGLSTTAEDVSLADVSIRFVYTLCDGLEVLQTECVHFGSGPKLLTLVRPPPNETRVLIEVAGLKNFFTGAPLFRRASNFVWVTLRHEDLRNHLLA